MIRSLFLLSIIAIAFGAQSDHWAVLVAGSNTYSNYRHQADICHAYQIMIANGILPSQIITLAYDDIANHRENPFPGQVFNQPNGKDVYAGCKLDYTGKHVTPANFLAIIQGESSKVSGGNGKVLKSNSKSKVFINFADHGAPGLIAFPSSYLYADDFISAIKNMHKSKMYDQMVIYIEACESGSMFDGLLPSNINVYATTAANPSESSWAAYCYPEDKVSGKHINSCLGDVYSVTWMEDSDSEDLKSETLGDQFTVVKAGTTKSHVQEYGDTSIKTEEVAEFQGDEDTTTSELFNRLLTKAITQNPTPTEKSASVMDSRDAKLNHLYSKILTDGSHKAHLDMSTELNSRQRTDHVFEDFTNGLPAEDTPLPRNFDCLRTMVNLYEENCGSFTDYALKYIKYFVRECEYRPETIDSAMHRLRNVCVH